MLLLCIELDICYVGVNNFIGVCVFGYEVFLCYLLVLVVKVLVQVEQDLCVDGFGLCFYDCYWLVCLVQVFMVWVNDLCEFLCKVQQYLDLDKLCLLVDGYIVECFGYSRGVMVDLGLLDCCSGVCMLLDMGIDFDFFGLCVYMQMSGLSEMQQVNWW